MEQISFRGEYRLEQGFGSFNGTRQIHQKNAIRLKKYCEFINNGSDNRSKYYSVLTLH